MLDRAGIRPASGQSTVPSPRAQIGFEYYKKGGIGPVSCCYSSGSKGQDRVRITLARLPTLVTLVSLAWLVVRIWSYAHRCLVKHAYLSLCLKLKSCFHITSFFTRGVVKIGMCGD